MTAFAYDWQLVFVDALFLCVAGCMGLWFRAWLRTEKRALDEQLQTIEQHRAHLERLSGRLLAACRLLEEGGGSAESVRKDQPARSRPEIEPPGLSGRQDRYDQARQLLTNGLTASAVARRLGLGIAEIELLARMMGQKRDD